MSEEEKKVPIIAARERGRLGQNLTDILSYVVLSDQNLEV